MDAGAGCPAVLAGSSGRAGGTTHAAMAGMIAPPPIEVRQLRKVFRQTASGQPVVAIDRLDLDVAPREVLAIVGQTGCGKSTFFDLMIGLEQPTAGSIRIGGGPPSAGLDYFPRPHAPGVHPGVLLAPGAPLAQAELALAPHPRTP